MRITVNRTHRSGQKHRSLYPISAFFLASFYQPNAHFSNDFCIHMILKLYKTFSSRSQPASNNNRHHRKDRKRQQQQQQCKNETNSHFGDDRKRRKAECNKSPCTDQLFQLYINIFSVSLYKMVWWL